MERDRSTTEITPGTSVGNERLGGIAPERIGTTDPMAGLVLHRSIGSRSFGTLEEIVNRLRVVSPSW